ncbi:MAG: phosphotransferase family protein [Bryobacterales bacterium]|nr:phosphotransferase family protein [Bryobacterales bacterium]
MHEIHLTDTSPIRPGEDLDRSSLSAYLSANLPQAASGFDLLQFPGGHSNLTYLLRTPTAEFVLRRAPLGQVPPKAHDMAREFRVLHAVHPHFPAAPKPHLLCEDLSVIGAVFYLMERRKGVVLRSEIPTPWAALPDLPHRVSKAFLDCLIELHSIDIVCHGLDRLGKPAGFVERQVKGWSERWYRARTEASPRMDKVIEFLHHRLPPDGPPALVHNDFKLDNLMLDAADPGRVAAVLDWEMTTVGDPLVDLGLTLCYWDPPDAEVREGPVPCLTRGPGWLTRGELIGQYVDRTGRDLHALRYHEILGIFKLAVIVQQIYQRWFLQQTTDERFATFDRRVRSLIEAAFERVEAEI